jgi:hypothetical protein
MPPQNAHPITLALNPKFLEICLGEELRTSMISKAPYFTTKETLD